MQVGLRPTAALRGGAGGEGNSVLVAFGRWTLCTPHSPTPTSNIEFVSGNAANIGQDSVFVFVLRLPCVCDAPAITLFLHGWYTVVTIMSHCCHSIATLLLTCGYNTVTPSLHCCHAVVTLLCTS